MYRLVYAKKFYEYELTAKLQKNGLYTLSCYCTDPDGYYCPSKSWTDTDVTYNEIELLFM